MAVTALLFGEVHGLTLAFGVTLLGVTIDYPIHLFSHLHPGELPVDAMRRIWKTLRLGAITTCIGYLALVSTDFTGLQHDAPRVRMPESLAVTGRHPLPVITNYPGVRKLT